MTSRQAVAFDVHEHVARITITRPEARNALDLDSMKALYDIANRCGSDRRVRAVVVVGAGDKAFCAGGDVAAFGAAADVGPEALELLLKEMTALFHLAISRLSRLDAPVIAAVNGVAAGAGLSLVAACDLAVAAAHATFSSAYTRLGLTPDGSSTWFLPRLIGPRRATELWLTNRTLNAAEALDWGLVNRVVPAIDLQAAADRLAGELSRGPTRAFGGAKKLLAASLGDALEAQMERETRQIVELSRTADGLEGIRAFVDKRAPRFDG